MAALRRQRNGTCGALLVYVCMQGSQLLSWSDGSADRFCSLEGTGLAGSKAALSGLNPAWFERGVQIVPKGLRYLSSCKLSASRRRRTLCTRHSISNSCPQTDSPPHAFQTSQSCSPEQVHKPDATRRQRSVQSRHEASDGCARAAGGGKLAQTHKCGAQTGTLRCGRGGLQHATPVTPRPPKRVPPFVWNTDARTIVWTTLSHGASGMGPLKILPSSHKPPRTATCL
eukprot:361619-Chlamydomonas_euryale.AAC.7